MVSSLILAEVVDRVGERFGLSEGLLGIVTALAADPPEIAAAVTAIERGRTGVGPGPQLSVAHVSARGQAQTDGWRLT